MAAWAENRRVKITLLREQMNKQDLTVEFEVSDEQKEGFKNSLDYLLAACINSGGEVASVEEVTDADTGAPWAANIRVAGPHDKIGPEINKAIGELKKFSVRSR